MKKKTSCKPTSSEFSVIRRLCNLIPTHPVPKLARDTDVADHARAFSPWSRVVGLLDAQLTHGLGL